jgi:Zn-dependent M28 family amino/carboxypeptidase
MLNRLTILGAVVWALAIPAGQATPPVIRVDAGQVFRDVETLAADDMEGRLAGSPAGRKAREYVLGRLKEAGVAALDGRFERPFTFKPRDTPERTGTNLVGVIRGRADPAQYIVLTAHYDHIGIRKGEVFNGADDNASGVAALLAVASHFSRTRPVHSLLIAVLDAEEAGHQGAKALMRDPPVPVSAMIMNVNLDMVGRDPDNRLFAAGVYHYPFLKPYLAHAAQSPVVLVFGHDTPGDREDWTGSSDHRVFHEAGIPFIYFGVEDFDQHHKATDDASTIGREFLAGAAATVIAAVEQFDAHLDQIAAARPNK